MAPILYYVDACPPVRAVLMTAKAIGLELELREINLAAGDHLKEEYLKASIHFLPDHKQSFYILLYNLQYFS